MGLDREIEFLYEVGSLRFMPRSWKQFLGFDAENIAEHTFRTVWIALILAKKEKADVDKVIKMALVHDIQEVRTGDINQMQRKYVERKEEEALKDMIKDVDLEEFKDIWLEFEKKETIEAKVVKDADYIDQHIELNEMASRGFDGKEKLSDAFSKMRARLFTKSAKELWDKITVSNPHDWHTKV